MDLDRHKAFLEALYAAAGAARDDQAHALAVRNGVTVAEARDAIQAATETPGMAARLRAGMRR